MIPALNDLVRRMTLKEDVKNSGDSTSWHAHREAEKLTDHSYIGELKSFVEVSPSKEERKAAYFILGGIGSNTADVRCAEILLRRTSIETDKYVLSALLGSVAKLPKPAELSLEAVFLLLHEKRWLVRHAAIQALRQSESAGAEERLLELLATTSDPHDKCYCHSTLNNIGSLRSIPLLTQSLTSRKRDVKSSAEAAIAAIQARHSA
jgi:HEAT repeat protein